MFVVVPGRLDQEEWILVLRPVQLFFSFLVDCPWRFLVCHKQIDLS